jgi:hypothetical protein
MTQAIRKSRLSPLLPAIGDAIPTRFKDKYLHLQNLGNNLGDKIFAAKTKTESTPGVWPALDGIDNRVPISEIVPGSKRVTIIGNNMGNGEFGPGIEQFAKNLREQGVEVNIFNESVISLAADREWRKLTSKGVLTSESVLNSKLYLENSHWVHNAVKNGDSIIDLGRLKVKKTYPDTFYEMEREVVYGK